MNTFFCADACRQANEDIIGSGTNYSIYVLIECPYPWDYNASESRYLPENLDILMREVSKSKLSVRFLLITQNQNQRQNNRKILIYEKEQSSFINGYKKYEFDVDHPEKMAPVIQKYLAGDNLDINIQENQIRDMLVCTHGSHDKCCAKYGNPFYMQAKKTISELGLKNTRIWKASHFGGHRFAPTMIDFPDGRYYGLLNGESFKSILLRTGNIKLLGGVYRGWGILPTCIQALERELMFHHGWEWFDYKINFLDIDINSDRTLIQTQLAVVKPDGSRYTCEGRLVKDKSKTIQLKGSCDATNSYEFIKYYVSHINFTIERKITEKVLVNYPQKKAS
ncbi:MULTISPECIES: sucrase ferredoxin [Okeania]|uniref:Sucrase ferredoxin n=1 Tax=Okeania hirsuta TaxID=1458930 RepID=A0A3N6NX48_9CYAN|nr:MULTISPECIES: sucrase ferredoxin [Okeania]NET12972.1 sucrase ferredoxin [Okeania sp. SIO1H6]NES76783.1 sucrase ferredoxin [Okeania sp. SIO1H4]NET20711.1 sucrase ferredoxin [Okeania sp. SIO1H5]NET93820.1 sucrase ferredoxin [Okeania sp. SIO1H2]RQH24211.1 sucrase ferredoxin [Okeania hirsuta]